MKKNIAIVLLLLVNCSLFSQEPRARDIGIPFDGTRENLMVDAETMEGINGNIAYAPPHKLVIDVLKKYNRIK